MEYKTILSLLAILIIPIFIAVKVFAQRRSLTKMAGMTIAMGQGMNVGLMVGVILGLGHPESIFVTTAISMLFGLTIGILSGLPFDTFAVLDGFLSGVMGGMMGAMIGVMVSQGYSGALLRMMVVIYLGTSAMILLTLGKGSKRKTFSMNGLIIPCLFAVVFYTFNVSHLFEPNPISNQTNNSQMDSMPSMASMDSKKTANGKTLLIKAEEFKYLPDKITVNRLEPITLDFKNVGSIAHDLQIVNVKDNPFKILKMPDKSNHESSGIHVHALPNEEQKITFIPTETGNYKFVCTIPGHKEAGMIGEIVVN